MSVILDFPNDPAAVDNIYVAPNGVTYYYDGVKWIGENSANNVSDRISSGDNSLIIDANGNVTFPDGFYVDPTDAGITQIHTGSAGLGATRGITVSTGFETNYVFIPGTIVEEPVGEGDAYPLSIGGKNGITISAGGDPYANAPGFDWEFKADGTMKFPNNIIDGGENSISVASGNYTDMAYINRTNPSTWGAGTIIDSIVGVDDIGTYIAVIAINDDNTDVNIGSWTLNSNGNLITEILHQVADENSTGDITDAAGNSLVYVPTTDTAPAHDHNGLLWFNTEDGRAYIRYNHQWVDANPPVVPAVSTYLDGLAIEGQTISSTDYVESAVKIGGDLLPDEDLTYNLGSPDRQWKHLYVDSHTIYMGGQAVSLTDQGLTVDGRTAVYEIDGGVAATWLTV